VLEGDRISSMQAQARSAGQRTADSTAFAVFARSGFVARGVLYATIGILAVQVAIHAGNEQTSQAGAMETIREQPFGHALLIVVAIGLGAYAAWKFVIAAAGSGPEGGGDGSTAGRLAAAAGGVAYAGLCVMAVAILLGSSSGSSGGTKQSTAGVLDWPAGQWMVGAAGATIVGIALYQAYEGLSRKFLEEHKAEEMGPVAERTVTALGVAGHLARSAAFGLVGAFVVTAAVEYEPKEAVGLDGALARLAHQPYGPYLLGLVAAGLCLFGLYSVAGARYRRI
jgi:hypothetical protein